MSAPRNRRRRSASGGQKLLARPGESPKRPAAKFQIVFSLIMGAMMVFLMTLVITLVNVGWVEGFLWLWAKAFVFAYVVAVPLIYFIAPFARKLTTRLLGPAG